jgi:hypothetical protein
MSLPEPSPQVVDLDDFERQLREILSPRRRDRRLPGLSRIVGRNSGASQVVQLLPAPSQEARQSAAGGGEEASARNSERMAVSAAAGELGSPPSISPPAALASRRHRSLSSRALMLTVPAILLVIVSGIGLAMRGRSVAEVTREAPEIVGADNTPAAVPAPAPQAPVRPPMEAAALTTLSDRPADAAGATEQSPPEAVVVPPPASDMAKVEAAPQPSLPPPLPAEGSMLNAQRRIAAVSRQAEPTTIQDARLEEAPLPPVRPGRMAVANGELEEAPLPPIRPRMPATLASAHPTGAASHLRHGHAKAR